MNTWAIFQCVYQSEISSWINCPGGKKDISIMLSAICVLTQNASRGARDFMTRWSTHWCILGTCILGSDQEIELGTPLGQSLRSCSWIMVWWVITGIPTSVVGNYMRGKKKKMCWAPSIFFPTGKLCGQAWRWALHRYLVGPRTQHLSSH